MLYETDYPFNNSRIKYTETVSGTFMQNLLGHKRKEFQN